VLRPCVLRIAYCLRAGWYASLRSIRNTSLDAYMSLSESFGDWLRSRRKDRALTQEELADHIGCSTETIRKMEAGRRRPSRQMVRLLRQYLGVPVEDEPALMRLARSGQETEAEETPASGYLAELPHLRTIRVEETSAGTAEPPLPRPLTNLPGQRTTFIGRETERARVAQLLLRDDVRLLTLTGAPGIGKTRLSFQVAADLLAQGLFPDGVYWTPLAPVTDPSLVLEAIAQSLKVAGAPSSVYASGLALMPRMEVILDSLRGKQMLLVLDNFEQVIPAGPLVVELLVACPRLKVMVSSREALNIYGEHEFLVPPLSMPTPQEPHTAQAISQSDAVNLFVQHSRAVNPDFALTDENAPIIAEICRQLDGLPLAIELAAARGKVLTPQAILDRLSSRLKLLTTAMQDLPPRQQTLRGAIVWSYDLLNEREKTLFRRMAVFVGGGTLDSIEAICRLPGEPERDPLDGISSLLSKSLLRRTDDPSGEARFRMLWTIREFGLERLAESGEENAIRRQHAAHFVRMAEAAEPHLESAEPERGLWLGRLEAERNDLRAALEWCRSEAGDPELGSRLAAALGKAGLRTED
jgi:predicted ATPase/transcriptional regulator with XRE-family HTH domain